MISFAKNMHLNNFLLSKIYLNIKFMQSIIPTNIITNDMRGPVMKNIIKSKNSLSFMRL